MSCHSQLATVSMTLLLSTYTGVQGGAHNATDQQSPVPADLVHCKVRGVSRH
jgi:hypothetical protein